MEQNAHILLTNAVRRPYRDPKMSKRAVFDSTAGLWMVDGKPLVTSNEFSALKTKKADQETGEDQKGE